MATYTTEVRSKYFEMAMHHMDESKAVGAATGILEYLEKHYGVDRNTMVTSMDDDSVSYYLRSKKDLYTINIYQRS